ncbi:hypothetical protein R1flu_001284 [Riccia fluitans]|uniref:Uncharacterized protein n=1 Tax=Riccia fluitans TaxID=41844 RepID=A0ABD1Y6V4_9MARC
MKDCVILVEWTSSSSASRQKAGWFAYVERSQRSQEGSRPGRRNDFFREETFGSAEQTIEKNMKTLEEEWPSVTLMPKTGQGVTHKTSEAGKHSMEGRRGTPVLHIWQEVAWIILDLRSEGLRERAGHCSIAAVSVSLSPFVSYLPAFGSVELTNVTEVDCLYWRLSVPLIGLCETV